jgi:hypothetical protein
LKKEKSSEEKAAWAKKMQEARAAKKNVDTTPQQPGYAELQRQVEELKALFAQSQAAPAAAMQQAGPQVANGRLIGTFTKHNLDPNYYPDPCERLSKEAKLQRFAFPVNYELTFNVSTSSYETKDGIQTVEPKFTLELLGIYMDEETGEPTNRRYIVGNAVFHEDPQSAIAVARENGIDINEFNEKDFLDEMRYLQYRDWLLERFYPPKSQAKDQRKEMVVNNRIVQYFEMSDENPTALPFGGLKGKL